MQSLKDWLFVGGDFRILLRLVLLTILDEVGYVFAISNGCENRVGEILVSVGKGLIELNKMPM